MDRMKRLLPYSILILILACPFSLKADDNAPLLPSDGEMLLIQLINEARRRPLAVAASYGKKPGQLIIEFPELADTLEKGLPPVSTHQALLGSSLLHMQDMLENNYYSKNSQGNDTPLDRMEANGFVAADGESLLGMLAFRNYMDEAKAVELIFQTMFLDELDSEWPERRCILDPAFTDVGVSVKLGKWVINGETLNVYIVVCDFGATAVNDAEATLMTLINQARRYPVQLIRALGLAPSEIFNTIPYLSEYTDDGMTPVRIHKKLYWTANIHAWEMLDMDYQSAISIDGRTPMQRILESGFPAQSGGEMIRTLSTTDPVDSLNAVGVNFERLLRRELDPENTANRKILNPNYSDAGPCVITIAPTADPDDEGAGLFDKYYVNFLVCDFASKKPDKQPPGIYGWAYYDENLNGLFDPEEGMAGASVTIRDKDGKLLLELFADNVGSFEADLASGEYLVIVDDGVVRVERRVDIGQKVVAMPVRIQLDNGELQN